MKSTFKVLFYLKKGSEKKNGEVMIMARITIDGKLCQFSTKQSIHPDSWNITAGKAKGKDAGRINALLEDIKASLNNIYHEQQRRDNYVTAEKVKNEFLGHSELSLTFSKSTMTMLSSWSAYLKRLPPTANMK